MNIGMVATRFAGLDGVSLEAAKVADALRDDGHTFSWFAGELGGAFAPGTLEPLVHFDELGNAAIQSAAFEGGDADGLAERIGRAAGPIARALEGFIDDFAVDALVVQNALTIPMQLPLGVALTRLIHESGIPVVAHHHDFSWERERFADCSVPEIVSECFPPTAPNLAHIVINRDAHDELRRRTGVEAFLLPNVMDFERGPESVGDRDAFRRAAGLEPQDVILLQPTRVIERKGIELTIDLAARLGLPNVKVVVTHADDLDTTYWDLLERRAADRDVDLLLVPIGSGAESLADAYAAADLVCFPSLYEGFGNALLEALFYRRPVFVNRYSVYRRDIAPTGIRCIEIDGEITGDAVSAVRRWLHDPTEYADAVEANYRIGVEHYSYQVVREVYERAFASIASA